MIDVVFTPPHIFATMMFDTDVTETFQKAIDKFTEIELRLATYSREYVGVGEWGCWSVANELRYAGQHLCRSLMPHQDKNGEQQLAQNHCRQAIHDANDHLILFFVDRTRDELEKTLAKCDGEDLEKAKMFQKKFWDICCEMSKLRRTDEKFEEKRQANIAGLQEVFRVIMARNRRSDSSDCATAKQQKSSLTGFKKNPSDEEIVEWYNEAEEYLKRFELMVGRVRPLHIRLIFKAACCFVSATGSIDRENFSEECGWAQIKILYDTLIFVMRSTGSTVVDAVIASYEKSFSEGYDYQKMKNELQSDIAYFIAKLVSS